MKKIIAIIIIFLTIKNIAFCTQTTIYKPQNFAIEKQNNDLAQNNSGVFWINFVIAAIGTYSIYGIGAGIVSVGITYFIVNGDKIAMKKAIWGCVLGMLTGGLIRLLTLL